LNVQHRRYSIRRTGDEWGKLLSRLARMYTWPRPLFWVLGALVLAVFVLFAGANTGLWPGLQLIRWNRVTYGIANTRIPQSHGSAGLAGRPNLKGCEAKVIGGSTLLLVDCQQGPRTAVSLFGVETLPLSHPLGQAAKEALAKAVDDERSESATASHAVRVDCSLRDRDYQCDADNVDLRDVLLEAGLAVITRPQDNYRSSLVLAESRARAAQIGIWWDYPWKLNSDGTPPNDAPDPILWRIGRDTTLASSETTQATRAEALAVFFTGLGVFLNFFLSLLRNHQRVRHWKRGMDKAALRTKLAMNDFREQCEILLPLQLDRKQINERFENYHQKLARQFEAFTEFRAALGKVEPGVQEYDDAVAWREEMEFVERFRARYDALINVRNWRPDMREFLKEVIGLIVEYETDLAS